jgi:hypothetical protein
MTSDFFLTAEHLLLFFNVNLTISGSFNMN